jgi:hypothetical protein
MAGLGSPPRRSCDASTTLTARRCAVPKAMQSPPGRWHCALIRRTPNSMKLVLQIAFGIALVPLASMFLCGTCVDGVGLFPSATVLANGRPRPLSALPSYPLAASRRCPRRPHPVALYYVSQGEAEAAPRASSLRVVPVDNFSNSKLVWLLQDDGENVDQLQFPVAGGGQEPPNRASMALGQPAAPISRAWA